jgi:hypothetical protein
MGMNSENQSSQNSLQIVCMCKKKTRFFFLLPKIMAMNTQI